MGIKARPLAGALTISVDGVDQIHDRMLFRGKTHRFRGGELEPHDVEIQLKLFGPDRAFVDGQEVVNSLFPAYRAAITVLEQQKVAGTSQVVTRLRFIEIDDQGRPLGDPKDFDVPDERVGFYAMGNTLPNEFVTPENLYGLTAICIFETIAGDNQATRDTPKIDLAATVPLVYRRDAAVSDDDQRVWASVFGQLTSGRSKTLPLRQGEVYKWTIGPGNASRLLKQTAGSQESPTP